MANCEAQVHRGKSNKLKPCHRRSLANSKYCYKHQKYNCKILKLNNYLTTLPSELKEMLFYYVTPREADILYQETYEFYNFLTYKSKVWAILYSKKFLNLNYVDETLFPFGTIQILYWKCTHKLARVQLHTERPRSNQELMSLAVKYNWGPIAKDLLEKYREDFTRLGARPSSYMHEAIRENNRSVTKELSSYCDIEDLHYALVAAIQLDRDDIAKFLISKGADVFGLPFSPFPDTINKFHMLKNCHE